MFRKRALDRLRVRRFDLLIGMGITLLVFILWMLKAGFLEGIELKTYDLRAKARKEINPGKEIAIIAVDDESIRKLGRWPWPRSLHSRLISLLAENHARIIAPLFLLSEPEESTGMKILGALEEKYRALQMETLGETSRRFYRYLQGLKEELDSDRKLEMSIRNAKNVIFPMVFRLQGSPGPRVEQQVPPDYLLSQVFTRMGNLDQLDYYPVLVAEDITLPLDRFGRNAAALGHINTLPDVDGVSRYENVVIEYQDNYYPSFGFQIAAHYLGIKPQQSKILFGEGIQLGDSMFIPTDELTRMIISYSGPYKTFNYYSYSDVIEGKVAPKIFKDKIVLIGATAAGIGDQLVTPHSTNFPSVEMLANVVENIIHQNHIVRPGWSRALELGIILAFGFFASIVLPRLKALTGSLVSLALLVAFMATVSVLFVAKGFWINMVYPTVLLVVSYMAITSRRFLVTEKEKEEVEEESDEANKMLGLAFQGKGMLDLAFEKFKKLPIDDEVKDILYNLGLDFERKRMIAKAITVYEHITTVDPKYKDIPQKLSSLRAAASKAAAPIARLRPREESTVMIEGATVNPTLGRYEIIGELGKGAMGIVYKGIDPKINRTVAIKTIRFEQDFDTEELEDVKKRFFREAETAGRLVHPNIVTIYDVGEDIDLSYIAMELLDGEDLIPYTKKGNLLPIRKVIDYVAQACDALDYAHSKGVYHRDIKPGNIMVTTTGQVKVMDFGIARISSSTGTQTASGIVLGTPSYMSPEQVAGKPIDGRSDIFSLGVVFYELLAGERPFKGDNIMTLLHQIATEDFPSPKQYNQKVPDYLVKVINKALAKDPAKRFQRASEMAKALRAFIEKVEKTLAQRRSASR